MFLRPFHPRPSARLRVRRRGVSAQVSAVTMVLNRSPLLQLLPEARIISTSGFAEAVKWSVAAIVGLGAYDSVSGASQMAQLAPNFGSLTVNAVAGDPLTFIFQTTGTPHVPAGYQTTPLPPGLTLTGMLDSTVDTITGIPAQAGTYPVTVTAWELAGLSGDSFSQDFTFEIVNPPLPDITSAPPGGNFTKGAFVSRAAGHNHGRTFTWSRNGTALPPQEKLFCPRTGTRKFRAAPAADPGPAWRSGAPFVESTDFSSETDPGWRTVSGGIGYDTDGTTGGDFLPHLAPDSGNVQSLMFGSAIPPKPVAIHLRMHFSLTNPDVLSYLTFRVQCDDGFVAWLNGTEIASQNAPAPLEWNSAASTEVTLTTPVTFREIQIPQHLGLLRPGANLLAVQAMNRATSSPDFLFNCELAGGINGTNSAALLLTHFHEGAAGNYALTVANPAGSISSSPVPVLMVPEIVTQPVSITIESGTAAQLSAAAEGSAPLSYQWYAGESGNTSSPVAGATGAIFSSGALTETARYWVRVSSPAGTADSATATVTVNPPDPYTLWKTTVFPEGQGSNPSISGPAADPDGDGFTNEQEYVFGTVPLVSESTPPPVISLNGDQIEVSFTARKATGPGYSGRTRHFAVETTSDVTAGPWIPLTGAAGIIANDQPVIVALPRSGPRTYCRLKVWLTP